MSRTYKTRPMWVNIANGYYDSKPVHHHEKHDCNLPPRGDVAHWSSWPDCYWLFVYTGRNNCGCWLCAGIGWGTRRADRRQKRHQAKREVRAMVHEYNAQSDIWAW